MYFAPAGKGISLTGFLESFFPVAESSRPLIQYDHRRTPHDQRRCPVGDDPYRQAPISILHDSFRIIVEDGFSQDTLRCVLEVMRNA